MKLRIEKYMMHNEDKDIKEIVDLLIKSTWEWNRKIIEEQKGRSLTEEEIMYLKGLFSLYPLPSKQYEEKMKKIENCHLNLVHIPRYYESRR